MKLSAELQKRAEAVEQTPNYHGPDLSEKTIIGLEAPFGVGKSTLADKCIEMLQEIGVSAGIIGTNTTRESRSNDPAYYVTEVSPELLVERGERGELINLTQFTTGNLYGTSAESLPNDVNIGPLMPTALQKFKDAGCKAVHAFYLTATPEQWQAQLDTEQRLSRPDVTHRINEAIESLEYALKKIEVPGMTPLIFISNDGTRTIEEMAGSILYQAGYQEFKSHYKRVSHYVREMYSHALILEQEIEAA